MDESIKPVAKREYVRPEHLTQRPFLAVRNELIALVGKEPKEKPASKPFDKKAYAEKAVVTKANIIAMGIKTHATAEAMARVASATKRD